MFVSTMQRLSLRLAGGIARPMVRMALIAVPAAMLAGCAGSGVPELPPVGALAAASGLPLISASRVVGTPTEVYTRIARGAVTCWFGATGPLKGDYIYHADAKPDSKGGGADIIIFGKDSSVSPDPRAIKAFQIAIKPTGGAPELGVENFRVPEPLAGRLRDDVTRWGEGEEGCGDGPVTQGWDAEQKAQAKSKQAQSAAKRSTGADKK
ncbi:MAG: hypothetical protein ACT4N2_03685 [Hyphomicrobium sp.]